jgi:hypothetical protein
MHQGSMLWSRFSAIFPNLRRTNWSIFLFWLKLCHKLAVFWLKPAIFVPDFFAENVSGIILMVYVKSSKMLESTIPTRVTRLVSEKIAQDLPQPKLCQN